MRLLRPPSVVVPSSFTLCSHVAVVAVALLASGCTNEVLERAAHEPGAIRDPSGAVFSSLRAGDGMTPGPDDQIKLSWQGRHTDGTTFDHGEAQTTVVSSTIPCFARALLRMHAGEKARITCPEYTTFAAHGVPARVPREQTLVYEIELLTLEGAVAKAATNEAATPGMKVRTLVAGTGPSPRASDRVKVQYEGKLASGKVFDSTLKRGTPAVFPLGGVIPCWRLLIPKMHVGEKAELTCPSEVAYGERGSPPDIPPNAQLTFEVELLAIVAGEE